MLLGDGSDMTNALQLDLGQSIDLKAETRLSSVCDRPSPPFVLPKTPEPVSPRKPLVKKKPISPITRLTFGFHARWDELPAHIQASLPPPPNRTPSLSNTRSPSPVSSAFVSPKPLPYTPISYKLGSPDRDISPSGSAIHRSLRLLSRAPFKASEVNLDLLEILDVNCYSEGENDVMPPIELVPSPQHMIPVGRDVEGRHVYQSLWEVRAPRLCLKNGAKLDHVWLTPEQLELLVGRIKCDEEIHCRKVKTTDFKEGYYYILSLAKGSYRNAFARKNMRNGEESLPAEKLVEVRRDSEESNTA